MLRRIFGKPQEKTIPAVDVGTGDFRQAIVGEASYQDELRSIAAGRTERGVRVEFRVVLIPEPKNKYDSNAVAIHAENGGVIGYLSREDAAEYQPSIIALMKERGSYPVCHALMFGGRGDKRSIGVWLDIDLASLVGGSVRENHAVAERRQYSEVEQDAPTTPGNEVVGTRTGASAHAGRWVVLTDRDLLGAIESGRVFLKDEQDPLERHYAFNTLEEALYKCRNASPSALAEFEALSEQHDREMTTIRPALISFFRGVPFLPTYKRVAIMKAKAGDHRAAAHWCERGLEVYGTDALESEGTTDLRTRLEKLSRKLL